MSDFGLREGAIVDGDVVDFAIKWAPISIGLI
jgi:hypothetical protein